MSDSGPRALLIAALERRRALLRADDLDACRLVNGAGDALPELHVDRFGDVLVATLDEAGPAFDVFASPLIDRFDPRAIFVKALRRDVSRTSREEQRPQLVHARDPAAGPETGDIEVGVQERGHRFVVRPGEGYSPGLFLDQRDNRARLAAHVARRLRETRRCSVLNTFAYTCSFSAAAANAARAVAESGAVPESFQVTSVDLSAHYLDWGKKNFEANGLDATTHDFVRGDALTFLQIAAKKGRRFDVVILDPPTFSTSKQSGIFQVERDYRRLFELAARVASPRATILASHNQRTFARPALKQRLGEGALAAGRRIVELEPFMPPSDFPGPDPVNPAARGFWVDLD